MWSQEQAVNVDVLFTKVLHCIEPGMKEIPCFIKNQKQVELWNVEAYHDYLCSGAESWSYLERLMKNDLDPDPNRPYHEKTEGMVYMCHMLREQIFSDFGYTDAEKPFLDILLGKTGKYIEEYDCAMAYRKVADHLYEREVFTYKGKLCRELADFADVIWEYEVDTWNLAKWDAFIEELFQQEEGKTSFLQWLDRVGTEKMRVLIPEFKKVWDHRIRLEEQKPKLNTISFEACIRWGNQEAHQIWLKEIDEQIEYIQIWKRESSRRRETEVLKNKYKMFFECLCEMSEHSPHSWDKLALAEEFGDHIQKWNIWEREIEQEYIDKKTLLTAIRKHDVLSCLSYDFHKNFWFHGRIKEKTSSLFLLMCAPVEETYRENCLKTLKVLQKWEQEEAEDFEEKVSSIVKDIYSEIFLKLFEENAPDAVLDYYFNFLDRIIDELLGVKNLKVIVRDDSLKKQVLSRIDSRVLTISGNNQLWSKDNSRKLECELRALPQRKHVDYTEFHKDTSYLNWVDEKKKLWAQESEWKKHSEIVKAKSDEAIAYVEKYWSVQNITQIKAGTEPMLKEMWQAFDKAKEQKIRCEARVSYANKKCEEVKKLCKAYEAEWDAKQKAKAEAEKEAEIRALRRKEAMKKVAVAAIILGIALVVFTGYKIKEYNEVKQSIAEYGLFGGVLDMEDYIDENGTLTLPSEVRGVTYSNICYMPLPEGVKKLIIPEGVVKISGYDNYEMDKYSPIGFVCSTLEEIEFPDSLETIYCKFKCPSLRTFSAENVTSVWHYGDNNLNALTLGYFFQSLDRLTSVHLPKLEQVYDSTFEGCRSLQELNVQGAQTVGVNAFKDCSSLTYLYLPTAWKLDMHVFENCSSLKAVYVPALKEMDAYAFSFINSLNGAVQVVLDTNGAYDETLMGSLQAAEERGEIVIMYQDYTQLDPAQLDELHQM